MKQNLEVLAGTRMKESLEKFLRLKANQMSKEVCGWVGGVRE